MFKTIRDGRTYTFDIVRTDDNSMVLSITGFDIVVPKYAMRKCGFLRGAKLFMINSSTGIVYVAVVDEQFQMDQFGVMVTCGGISNEEFDSIDDALEWLASEMRLNSQRARIKTASEHDFLKFLVQEGNLPGYLPITFANTKAMP